MELTEVLDASPAPVSDVVEPPVSHGGRGLGILGGIGFLFIGLGIAAIGYWVFLSGSPTPQPVQPAPPPVAPVPPPEPEPQPSVLTFATEPNGATVTLDGQDICTTPCEIELPEDATLPLTYSVVLEGYVPEDYIVTEAAGSHHLRLVKKTSRPRPRPRPEPTPVPETVPPVPAAPRPEPVADSKPEPETEIKTLEEVRDPFN